METLMLNLNDMLENVTLNLDDVLEIVMLNADKCYVARVMRTRQYMYNVQAQCSYDVLA